VAWYWPLSIPLVPFEIRPWSLLGALAWHQFDLPKCQVYWGNAAVCLNVHPDGLFVYFLHLAPKTSKRTIDDLYDAAFESLLMFSHTTILS
jgi:hypothetical protein